MVLFQQKYGILLHISVNKMSCEPLKLFKINMYPKLCITIDLGHVIPLFTTMDAPISNQFGGGKTKIDQQAEI